MRVAWLGPVGEGGGAGLGLLLLSGFADLGEEIDLYVDGAYAEAGGPLAEVMNRHPRLTAVVQPNSWKWDRWYSRNQLIAFASGLAWRAWVHRRLGRRVVEREPARRYDCIFQFSQTELQSLGANRDRLPPIVVHPCSHAAGELRWHRRESAYARQSESAPAHFAARMILWYRARVQRRELARAALVVGPSQRFVDQLREDYGLPDLPVAVLRHPVDLARFVPETGPRPGDRPIRLLYASRMSTRKGVELIVGLSHRLCDLAGGVELALVGGKTLWSDYRRHLEDLEPKVARYLGPQPPEDMPAVMRSADALLMPSHYEPGALVVGEALASGLPVVVSDCVGPAEVLNPRCCRVFRSGDLDGFEAEVRRLVGELRTDRDGLASLARAEAEQFAPAVVAERLREILAGASRKSRR